MSRLHVYLSHDWPHSKTRQPVTAVIVERIGDDVQSVYEPGNPDYDHWFQKAVKYVRDYPA